MAFQKPSTKRWNRLEPLGAVFELSVAWQSQCLMSYIYSHLQLAEEATLVPSFRPLFGMPSYQPFVTT